MTTAQTIAPTTAQIIALDFDDEMKSTRRLLERVPLDDAHRSYQPHPKSMTLDRLASHVAELPAWPKFALESELLEIPSGFKPAVAGSSAELLAMFDRAVEQGRAAILAATDEDMLKHWNLSFGGQIVYGGPRPNVLRAFLNHIVHHRAQLGVYLRLNNIPINGMYGPSADEQ